jgi:hypothetical protein
MKTEIERAIKNYLRQAQMVCLISLMERGDVGGDGSELRTCWPMEFVCILGMGVMF